MEKLKWPPPSASSPTNSAKLLAEIDTAISLLQEEIQQIRLGTKDHCLAEMVKQPLPPKGFELLLSNWQVPAIPDEVLGLAAELDKVQKLQQQQTQPKEPEPSKDPETLPNAIATSKDPSTHQANQSLPPNPSPFVDAAKHETIASSASATSSATSATKLDTKQPPPAAASQLPPVQSKSLVPNATASATTAGLAATQSQPLSAIKLEPKVTAEMSFESESDANHRLLAIRKLRKEMMLDVLAKITSVAKSKGVDPVPTGSAGSTASSESNAGSLGSFAALGHELQALTSEVQSGNLWEWDHFMQRVYTFCNRVIASIGGAEAKEFKQKGVELLHFAKTLTETVRKVSLRQEQHLVPGSSALSPHLTPPTPVQSVPVSIPAPAKVTPPPPAAVPALRAPTHPIAVKAEPPQSESTDNTRSESAKPSLAPAPSLTSNQRVPIKSESSAEASREQNQTAQTPPDSTAGSTPATPRSTNDVKDEHEPVTVSSPSMAIRANTGESPSPGSDKSATPQRSSARIRKRANSVPVEDAAAAAGVPVKKEEVSSDASSSRKIDRASSKHPSLGQVLESEQSESESHSTVSTSEAESKSQASSAGAGAATSAPAGTGTASTETSAASTPATTPAPVQRRTRKRKPAVVATRMSSRQQKRRAKQAAEAEAAAAAAAAAAASKEDESKDANDTCSAEEGDTAEEDEGENSATEPADPAPAPASAPAPAPAPAPASAPAPAAPPVLLTKSGRPRKKPGRKPLAHKKKDKDEDK